MWQEEIEKCVLRTDRGRHSDGTEIGEKCCGDTVLSYGQEQGRRGTKTASPAEQAQPRPRLRLRVVGETYSQVREANFLMTER